MKRILSILLVLLLAFTTLVACGPKECAHDYETVVTDPTCTATGITTKTCKLCGDVQTCDETAALGHNYVKGVCSNCNAVDPSYVDEDLKAAYDLVHQYSKDIPAETRTDYTLTMSVPISDKEFAVKWEIVGTEAVVINGNKVIVTASADAAISYTLKYTVTNEKGETLSREYSKTVPQLAFEDGVVAPVVGTAYKFGLVQGNLEGAILYLNGKMNGYYMDTTEDMSLGVDVYLEATEGGYYLYAMINSAKTYINFVASGTGFVNAKYESKASSVFTYNANLNTVVTLVDDVEYCLGTKNDGTYDTVGPVKTSTAPFYHQFYTIPADLTHEHSYTDGKCECGAKDPNANTQLEYPVVNTLNNGDIVIIGAPAYDIALSVNKTGFYNVGVSYVNGFSAFTNSEKFVVTVNDDGSYTFTSVSGVVVALGAENSSLKEGTEGIYTKWQIIAKDGAEGIFYIKNTDRDTEHLEWYASKNNWSVYHPSTLDNCYELSFYLVEAGSNIPACEHDYTTAVTEPTCETEGYTTYTCSKCGEIKKDNYVDATGHNYVDGTCSVCGNVVTAAPSVGKGYIISCFNANGLVYFNGAIDNGRFTGTANVAEATVVYVEAGANAGEYLLYFLNNDVKNYIIIDDKSQGAVFTTDVTAATVLEWNGELATFAAAEDTNNRAFGMDATKTFTTFSTYDLSNTNYNWGQFTAVDGADAPAACEHVWNDGVVTEPTCGAAGYTTYTCTLCNNTKKENEVAATGNHSYTEGTCTVCGAKDPAYVDPNAPSVVDPVVGTAYKFGMINTLKDNNVYYICGGMASTYYLATSSDLSAALDVYLETADGGYYLYAMDGSNKLYINCTVSGTHVNAVYGATAETVYTYDETLKTLTIMVTVEGEESAYVFGTRNDKNYTTVGFSKASMDPFYCQFYAVVEGGETPVDPQPPVGGDEPSDEPSDEPTTNEMTIAEVLASAEGTNVIVTGTVVGIYQAYNSQYDNISVYIADDNGNRLLVFRLTGNVEINDVITVTGSVTDYYGTKQIAQGGTYVKIGTHTCDGHYIAATCTSPATCAVCGTESGEALGHTYVDGACSVCEVKQPGEGQTETSVSKSHTDIAGIAGVTVGQNTGVIADKEIALNDDITIVCAKGSASSDPCIYTESIRMYQNGNTLTVKAAEGCEMTTIVITLATKDGGHGPITVTGGTASALTNLTYTITVEAGVSEVVITTAGTDKNNRLYVANIEVIYNK